MSDKLVYDLANEINDSPNIFVRKDYINLLDNNNGNYSSNQSVVDTSSLSSNNKYLSLREAYLSMPLLITLTGVNPYLPATAATSADNAIGLKNGYHNMVHSVSVDLNGSTIIQQSNYINIFNAFKLLTTLSWNDVITEGSTIGFYPDNPLSFAYAVADNAAGAGVSNNTNLVQSATVTGVFTNYESSRGNLGFLRRQQNINYDPAGVISTAGATYNNLLTANNCNLLWKSYIFNKTNGAAPGNASVMQINVRAVIMLKHLHSYFNNVPLLKGCFYKITLYLNNSTVEFSKVAGAYSLINSTVQSGGVCPLMLASGLANNGGAAGLPDAVGYRANLSVGNTTLDPIQRQIGIVGTGNLGNNVLLYVPLYSFNRVFEGAYLSNPIKQVKYTDVYQYQIPSIGAGASFTNLITSGISNIKSVLVVPFYTSIVPGGAGVLASLPPWQSPFDGAGSGCTSPLIHLTNFNVQLSGANVLYNQQRYTFEAFQNNLNGCNSVNGGMTDGLTSGLIDQLGFETSYCYYFVDCSRGMVIEETVPKSVQLVGTNTSSLPITLMCYIEYGVEVSIDALTSQRVNL